MVSDFRRVPDHGEDTIIGCGAPRMIWSRDFVLSDRCGILLVDFRRLLRIWPGPGVWSIATSSSPVASTRAVGSG